MNLRVVAGKLVVFAVCRAAEKSLYCFCIVMFRYKKPWRAVKQGLSIAAKASF